MTTQPPTETARMIEIREEIQRLEDGPPLCDACEKAIAEYWSDQNALDAKRKALVTEWETLAAREWGDGHQDQPA